jgi:hypothetical protein
VSVLAAATLLVSLAEGHSATPAGPASEPRPSALWRAFPLRVRSTEAPLGRAAPADASALPAVVRRDGSSRNAFVVAAGIGVLVLGACGAAFLLLRGPAGRWSRAATAAISEGRADDQVFTLTPMVPRSPDHSYLVIVPGRMGWGDRLVEREGELPTPGEVIVDDELGTSGQAYIVEDVEPSPLPEDTRPCAVLRAL